MTFRLVHARYSLPEWQAVKLIFFAPCHLVSQDSNHNDDADCDGCGNDINDDDDDDVDEYDDDGGDDDSDKDDNGNNDVDDNDDNDDKLDNNNIGYSFTRSCCGTGSKLLSS